MEATSSPFSRGSNYPPLLAYAALAARTLADIANSNHIPFLQPIANVSMLILDDVNLIKASRNTCLCLIDLMHRFECTIIAMAAAYKYVFPLNTLHSIGNFAETLQKIHGCLRSQKERSRIRRFLRRSEITTQLEACQIELEGVLNTLKLEQLVNTSVSVTFMESSANERHQELISLLETQDTSEHAGSVNGSFQTGSSSSLFSLLPPYPKIFHGRQTELNELVHGLRCLPARVAILGTAGIGKTTLAIAALHHPDIMSQYGLRCFVSCEAATTNALLLTTVGLHLGLEPSSQPINTIIQYLSQCGPILLVLDNLEAVWEQRDSRNDVEGFLALLSGIPHLALLITMRGSERPGRIKWRRPFLAPLEPLHPTASRQIFEDISDAPNSEEEADFSEILDLTGHVPLAVSLMASITAIEGYSNALIRWKKENTVLLSEGYKKGANLEKSIILSLTSPRIASRPGAKELLSVLSILPDGLAQAECTPQNIPISQILECKSVLLRTSLAYIDADGRLKALRPIREYIHRENPPNHYLVEPLGKYWQGLLSLWDSHRQLPGAEVTSQLTSNIGNIDSLINYHLDKESSPSLEVLHSILTLSIFSQNMLKADSTLLPLIPKYISSLGDEGLRWKYFMLRLRCAGPPVADSEARTLIPETVEYLRSQNDQKGLVAFCNAVVIYYLRAGNVTLARDFNQIAMALISETTASTDLPRAQTYSAAAGIERQPGNYHKVVFYAGKGQVEARKEGTIMDELACATLEADAFVQLGNLSHALDLCDKAHDLLVLYGLQGSDRDLSILDIAAEIAYNKSQLDRATALYQSIAQQTSPSRSSRFHIYASLCLIDIQILLGETGSELLEKLCFLKERSRLRQWDHGCLFADILMVNLHLSHGHSMAEPSVIDHVQCFLSAQKSSDAQNMFRCLERLADREDSPQFAVRDNFRWVGTYLAFACKNKHLLHIHQALRCLGDIFMEWGDMDTALNLFYAGLEGSKRMGIQRCQADCVARIDRILRTQRSETV